MFQITMPPATRQVNDSGPGRPQTPAVLWRAGAIVLAGSHC